MNTVRTCRDFDPDDKTTWCEPCQSGKREFCLDKDSHTSFSQRLVVEQEVERLRVLHSMRHAPVKPTLWTRFKLWIRSTK